MLPSSLNKSVPSGSNIGPVRSKKWQLFGVKMVSGKLSFGELVPQHVRKHSSQNQMPENGLYESNKPKKALAGIVDKQALNTPLRAFLSRYKTDISVFKASYNVEKYIIGKWQKHEIARLPIGAVTSARLMPVLTDYQKRYKPETIRKDFGVLRHLFNIVKTQWHVPIDVNPVEQIRLPSIGRLAVRRLPRGAWDAIEAIYSEETKPEIFLLAKLALETAMRRSELLRLEWEDVDRHRRLITVREGKNGYARYIPMSNASVWVFEQLDGQDARVFGLSPSGVANAWIRLRDRAGYSDIRFHDLRHEAISRFFEKGLSVPEVASISGHRTPSQLFRYAHADTSSIMRKLTASSQFD